MIGTPDTRLVILRGNSGSGKSSVARALQKRRERSQLAVVSQDVIRRDVLWTWDRVGTPAILLMDLMTRYSLNAGFSVIVEGMLHPDRYAEMLTRLVRDHQGLSRAYFWDLPFEETVRRHETKERASEFGEADMHEWWYGAARIAGLDEESIGLEWSLDATVRRIEDDCRWL